MRMIFKSLIEESKDGEWGKGEPFEDSVQMLAIRGADFDDVRIGVIDEVPARHIAGRIAERKTLRPHDIVFETAGGGKDRPTGRSLFIKDSLLQKSDLPLTCASFSRFIRIDGTKADPEFIFWKLQHMYSNGVLKKYHTQHTGVARFQYTVFSETEKLDLPELDSQRKIASILSAYDDLIENNTRRIKILEEMAQAIYRELFVEFRTPAGVLGTKAGAPGVELRKATAEEQKLTGKDKFPKGWDVRSVVESVFISPKTTVPKEGQKPFVSMASLANNSMLINDVELKDGNGGSKFKNGDTLFARITPCLENGKTGFVQFLKSDDDVAFGSTEFIVLRSRTLTPEYVYLMARTNEFRDNAIKSMSGATGRQRVQEKCFEKFFIAQPNSETLKTFDEVVQPMFRLTHSLSIKNENLRRTRDLLLPKLISGEVEV